MERPVKLRICDSWLLVLTALMLASGIQLEATSGAVAAWVWAHVAGGIILALCIWWHVKLHKQAMLGTPKVPHRRKPAGLRWLAVAWALTLITGIVATAHWVPEQMHSTIGGVHGKIGFLAIILAVPHVAKKWKFYRHFSLFLR